MDIAEIKVAVSESLDAITKTQERLFSLLEKLEQKEAAAEDTIPTEVAAAATPTDGAEAAVA